MAKNLRFWQITHCNLGKSVEKKPFKYVKMWPLILKLPAKVCNCPGHIFRLSNVHPRVGCPQRKTWSGSVESTWNNWKKNQEKKCWRKFKFGIVLLLWNGAQNFLHHGQVFSVVMCLKYALDMCALRNCHKISWNNANVGSGRIEIHIRTSKPIPLHLVRLRYRAL